jgi:hypothetical protein
MPRGTPTLAAKIANQLADFYIDWQRKAKLEQAKDATAWLSTQIEVLRKKAAEEAAAEQFRSSQGLLEGKLRALEREAEARRDLLESYLAHYRDASARHDIVAPAASHDRQPGAWVGSAVLPQARSDHADRHPRDDSACARLRAGARADRRACRDARPFPR